MADRGFARRYPPRRDSCPPAGGGLYGLGLLGTRGRLAVAIGTSGGCGTSRRGGVGTPLAGDRGKPAERVEERRKGYCCLSPWDGNHDTLEKNPVRLRLNDLGCVKTARTLAGPSKAGIDQIRLYLPAKTACGGRVGAIAVVTFRNDDCRTTLARIAG